ncbi:cell envelope biogenesis protein OmpA [Flavobacterium sp. 316]|uniref:OmpA family protein n=1 Tax=Flavobacterium sp. 316 TaxID=1603293 RepID=UPI0005DE4E7D|nr:OmpA family protein [Flavobacterium sp. 316]KIX22431.1 cell envelope biogenesis protein OmpA [Flavobacterium sp. 316]
MKRNCIRIGFLLAITMSFAQNKTTQKADKLFESYQYVNAIEEYLTIANKEEPNQYVFKQLGDSYYNLNNYEAAAKWYAKAVETKKVDAETYYYYAQTLKSQGKYKEANAQMDVFAYMIPNDIRAIEHKKNPNYIPSLANKSKLFDVLDTAISSKEANDFGAYLTNDNTLYFVSTRNSSGKTDKWNNQPYLDIFKIIRNSDGTLSESTPVNELNTPYHDGPVTISADGKTMFFARDGHSTGNFVKNKNTNVKVGQQGLYKAILIDGKWSQVEPLPFNSTAYSVSSPSLSKDGKTLYFASNMVGGLGESDIWKVEVQENGFGTPINLGTSVNTPEKENFPFITDDNELYFASSGKQGFGGLDVFKIDLNKSEEAINLGKPVNTEKDDFSFSVNKKLNIGYFSSNRNGFDAIYSATPVCKAQTIVLITDSKTGYKLSNANVAILDSKGNIITTQKSDSQGKVIYDVECDLNYTIKATLEHYEIADASLKNTVSGINNVNIEMVPEEVIITETEVLLNDVYFDFNKSNITDRGATELDKLVRVMLKNPTMVIQVKSHTDSKGNKNYNLKLSERRAQSTVQYIISKGINKDRISGKGYGSTMPKINCDSNCTDEQHAQNRRSEFIIVKK